MKIVKILMGMPITIEVVDKKVRKEDIDKIFNYFDYVDKKFSTYKKESEISQINSRKLTSEKYSKDMAEVLFLCDETKNLTHGYFNILREGELDPSGLVKGWSIYKASKLLKKNGFNNFCIDAGGDLQISGKNLKNKEWSVGIRNPFNRFENIKVLNVFGDIGIATSGTAIRGNHIYDPYNKDVLTSNVVSLTVIGPNIYEADRFATSSFAMGMEGINFIESLNGFEGYMIDKNGLGTSTSNFNKYTKK